MPKLYVRRGPRFAWSAGTPLRLKALRRLLCNLASGQNAIGGLRAEVNSDGVRVLSVYPGRTAIPMQAAIIASEGRAHLPEKLLQPDDVAATVVSALMLPRTAEVTDVKIRPLTKIL